MQSKKILSMVSSAKQNLSSPKNFFIQYGLFVILAAIFIFFAVVSPYFFQFRNFMNILVSVSIIGIIATTMTLTIIGRGPDLTVGSIIAMSGCIVTNLVLINGLPWYVGIIAALAIGVLVGYLNGFIIVKFNLSPFIVTLGMMNVVRGFCYVLVDGLAYFIDDPRLLYLGRAKWLTIPLPIIVLVLSFIVFDFILKKTVFGRQIFASGGNRAAARLAGINVKKNAIVLFVLSGLMASISGLVVIGISGAAIPNAGEAYALDTVTAVLLGGTTLAGGLGSVRRTFLGILIIGILNNGMALLNVQTYWQIIAKGTFLLGAVILDSLQHQRK